MFQHSNTHSNDCLHSKSTLSYRNGFDSVQENFTRRCALLRIFASWYWTLFPLPSYTLLLLGYHFYDWCVFSGTFMYHLSIYPLPLPLNSPPPFTGLIGLSGTEENPDHEYVAHPTTDNNIGKGHNYLGRKPLSLQFMKCFPCYLFNIDVKTHLNKGCVPLRIMVHQRNRWIHDQNGFQRFLWSSMIWEWYWMTDPGSDHHKGTHPKAVYLSNDLSVCLSVGLSNKNYVEQPVPLFRLFFFACSSFPYVYAVFVGVKVIL